ncbi:MAG: hypothetical protein JNL13_02935 [Chitinophagaceae bacterium]|nr:hypothetical protein [Chitinophagaceae bacterium]
MAKLIDISKDSLKHSVTRSVTKRRTTFWQMMRCMSKLEYRPSFLLVLTVVGSLIYMCTPLSLFSDQPLFLRFIDDLFVLFIVLKVLSHETHRFTRYKARSRRSCCE